MIGGPPLSHPEVLGDYQVLGRLASGGMAELFLGRRVGPSGSQRAVALKMILPHLAQDKQFVTMFLDEARIAASIHHPNVVVVEELRSEGEHLFMVMEYLAGESAAILASRLEARKLKLDPFLAAFIVAEVCSGLHAAHELTEEDGSPCAIIHRDVSPANIFLTYDGVVKILDFGVAKADRRATRTESGYVKGKFEYMSPEQIMGAPLDRRADIFPAGIVLFELLTGRRLFKGVNDAASVRVVLEGRIDPPSAVNPAVPASLDEICLKALARSRRRRYETAAAMGQDLVTVIREEAPEALFAGRLATLMQELFAERIASKQEMLRQARESNTVESIVESETTAKLELPEPSTRFEQELTTKLELPETTLLFEKEPPTKIREAKRVRGRSPKAVFVVAVVTLALLVVAGASAIIADRLLPPTSPQATTPAIDPHGDLIVAAPAPTVTLTITSDPPGAAVTIDGEERFNTPGALTMAQRQRPLKVTFLLEGYRRREELVVPTRDLTLEVHLVEEPAPPLQAQPPLEPQHRSEVDGAPSEPPADQPRIRRRWPRRRPTGATKTKATFELWE